jgi:hypothetical protein
MNFRNTKTSFILCVCLSVASQGYAQDSDGGAGHRKGTVDARIKRQHMRINNALQKGTIDKKRASDLNSSLDDLQALITTERQKNGGQLKPEQLQKVENELNQSNHIITSFEQSGTSVKESGKVLGPQWTKGQDGAQDSKSLLKQMKVEQRREVRQARQAYEQKLEQQQLDYEKGMMAKFGSQRKNILQQKQDLDQARQSNGAN